MLIMQFLETVSSRKTSIWSPGFRHHRCSLRRDIAHAKCPSYWNGCSYDTCNCSQPRHRVIAAGSERVCNSRRLVLLYRCVIISPAQNNPTNREWNSLFPTRMDDGWPDGLKLEHRPAHAYSARASCASGILQKSWIRREPASWFLLVVAAGSLRCVVVQI